ncbi:MAG: pyridoxal 5'-phosphate synthase glutaminase subunit PdxT [Anaerolineae bacterium]
MQRVGVLALQGAFREHVAFLNRLGVEAVEVRRASQLDGLDGLIMPGGESTTVGKLAVKYDLLDPIREMARKGAPIWGTCAGMILLAKDVHRDQPLLELMDVQVQRNAFGRQVDSFEADLDVPALGDEPFRAIFIRAPLIETVGPGVDVLARLEDGTIVAARQENLLATSFHPELTDDTRFHSLFLQMNNGG